MNPQPNPSTSIRQHQYFCDHILLQKDEMQANQWVAFENAHACDQIAQHTRQKVLPIFYTIAYNSFEMFSWCTANMSMHSWIMACDAQGFGLLEWASIHNAEPLLFTQILQHYQPITLKSKALEVPAILCNRSLVGWNAIDRALWQEGWHSFEFFLKHHQVFELYLNSLEPDTKDLILKVLENNTQQAQLFESYRYRHPKLFTKEQFCRAQEKLMFFKKMRWFQLNETLHNGPSESLVPLNLSGPSESY